jgi:hypothetical protein
VLNFFERCSVVVGEGDGAVQLGISNGCEQMISIINDRRQPFKIDDEN